MYPVHFIPLSEKIKISDNHVRISKGNFKYRGWPNLKLNVEWDDATFTFTWA